MMIKVRKVESLRDFTLRVWFSDGSVGEWDHSDILSSTGPIAVPLHNPAYFAQVFVEEGALVWPNGYDVCPVTLHGRLQSAGALQTIVAAQ